MNRQGQRTDLTSVPVAQKSTSRELLGKEVGESQDQVRRYIRLTELIPELLDLVDEGRIAFRPAVELSYLQKDEQSVLLEQIAYVDATPSLIRRSVGEQTLWSRKDEIYSHISTTEIKKELKKWRFPKRSRIQGQKANTNPPKY